MASIKVVLPVVLLVVFFTGIAGAQDYASRDELISLARTELRMITDTFAISDTTLALLLNESVKETDKRVRYYQKLDTIWTTAKTTNYSLNTDCYDNGVVSMMVLADSAAGKYAPLANIASAEKGTLPSGTVPLYYSVYGQRVSLYPQPPKVYRIEIEYEARTPVYYEGDDTLTAIDPEHEQLIVDYTIYLALKRMMRYQEAFALKQQWENDVAISRALEMRKPDPLINRIVTGQ